MLSLLKVRILKTSFLLFISSPREIPSLIFSAKPKISTRRGEPGATNQRMTPFFPLLLKATRGNFCSGRPINRRQNITHTQRSCKSAMAGIKSLAGAGFVRVSSHAVFSQFDGICQLSLLLFLGYFVIAKLPPRAIKKSFHDFDGRKAPFFASFSFSIPPSSFEIGKISPQPNFSLSDFSPRFKPPFAPPPIRGEMSEGFFPSCCPLDQDSSIRRWIDRFPSASTHTTHCRYVLRLAKSPYNDRRENFVLIFHVGNFFSFHLSEDYAFAKTAKFGGVMHTLMKLFPFLCLVAIGEFAIEGGCKKGPFLAPLSLEGSQKRPGFLP